MLFAPSHGVAGGGQSALALEASLSSFLHSMKQSVPGKRLRLAAGRLRRGMRKWPKEKIIQEAGLRGKEPRRGVCEEPGPLPLMSHPFSSSTQLQVTDLLVLINSPNAGKTSKFQLSALLGFHSKGSEGVMPGIVMSGGGTAGEVPPLPGPAWALPPTAHPHPSSSGSSLTWPC